MKKGIKMEKLIELLNEFEKEVYADEHEHIEYPDWTWDDWEYWFEWDSSILGEEDWLNWSWSDYRCYNSDLVIISKKFWFIEWLVKHFMLDMTKLDARIALSDFNATDRMLMALAISEDPIALLVDCLKTEWTETIE